MENFLKLLLALTFLFGGLANAQQERGIDKPEAKAYTDVNIAVGAFNAHEKPVQKPILRNQTKLNSFLDFGARATTVYSEDFSGGMGEWIVLGLGEGCWSVQDDSMAGGTSPELTLKWVSGIELNGSSYCMSPVINTEGYAELALEFKQQFRIYANSVSLGVYTTIDNGTTWEEIWLDTVSTDLLEVKNLFINNAHVGNSNFRFAFVFNGNIYDIQEWTIDDILLINPDEHDLGIIAITPNSTIQSDSTVTPKVTVKNFGANNESSWSLTLTDGNAYTSTVSDINILPTETKVIDMDDWTPTEGDYTLTATLTLTGDANESNNTLTQTVSVIEYTKAFAWNIFHQGGVGAEGAGPVNIFLENGVMTQIAIDESYFVTAADYVGDEIYGIRYADGSTKCPLVKIDPTTGAVTEIGGGASYLTGFAYDVTTGTAYVINVYGKLSTIDLETGVLTNIGGDFLYAMCLTCDANGNLFSISLDDRTASIDKATGKCTVIGNLGIDVYYAQDICFDRDNNILYGTLFTASLESGLYTIDLTTGAANLIVEIFDELAGFAIPYTFTGPLAISKIPAVNASKVAVDTEISVTFNVDITATDLSGITITPDPGNISASIDGNKLTIAHDNFANNTIYTVLVPAGTVTDGTSTNENPVSWYFTTEKGVGISDVNVNSVLVYPNPSNGMVNLQVSDKSFVTVVDMLGRVVDTYDVGANETITFRQSAGIYIIKVESNGRISTHNLIVN
ncbi:MAG TPA: Ig-like domain-containing protein [Salinivirgaceae bacterium]|nr:Ig-like domain-containing protein [Salinivirgaceae bacterium]HQA76510.1 Ig-like domain-containing protein [Salinivirgaceae bacterium]